MPDDPSTPGSGTGDSPAEASSAGPTILSRRELRKQSRTSRTWWYLLSSLAVVVAAVVIAVLVTQGNKSTAAKVAATTTVATTPAQICPLTGAPSPGGAVPARPALGIKIGNYPGDRPSSGLNQADIVFEEPVEGAITRLVAVFQCQGAALVGDIRSARQPDAGILSQLSNPLFVHAGGINPVIALMQASALIDKNLYSGGNGSAIIQQPGRVAPYSTFVNTATLWGLQTSDTTPPAPIFSYSAALPKGSVASSGASVHIPFSSSSDVTWQWNATTGTYLRFYSGQPDKLLNGSQTAASNVVVMTVPTAIGSWVENSEGGHEVDVTATGSGPLVVLRNGVAITGTWTRPTLTQPATLTSAAGVPITLRPGSSWVELAPVGIPVTPAAAPPRPAATATTKAS
jgi:Protein of unknown function (DUF3048) N-terminal domain/Protein of unknown function (DUF3048) C-terminal domain